MYYIDNEVVRQALRGPQLEIMKQLLRLGWRVSRIAEWNGTMFVTTLECGYRSAKFSFDRAWPFLVFNGQREDFLKFLEKAGL